MHQDRLEVPQNQVTILESQRTKMDTIKATGRRVSRSLSEMAFNLDALKEIIGCESNPKRSLSERMVHRYSSVSVEDAEETKANTLVSNIFRRRRSSTNSNKSSQFKQLPRQLSEEEREINKERLAAVGDLMSVFADEGEDISSDQDDLIEELQDIGYIITPKHNDVNTTNVLDEGVLKTKNARHTYKNTKQNRNSSFRMVRERKRHSIISTDF